MSQVIYRTYRPKTFQEVTGQEHVVRTIQNQHATDTVAHAYVFAGPRGVGKTTMARLLARLINCDSPKENEPCNVCEPCTLIAQGHALDVYEIDAASHTGVDHVREAIIDSVRFAPQRLRKKVYIIDEVHMLSASAFNALLKTLEEPPEHALFILATTEIHKVPETIMSRCQRFDFKRISIDDLVRRMGEIVNAEGVRVEEDVLRAIAKHSGGCARDAESLLGQILALGEQKISMDEASLVLPLTDVVLIEQFIASLYEKNTAQAIAQLNAYLESGIDLRDFLSQTISWLRDRLLEVVGGEDGRLTSLFLQRAIEALRQAQEARTSERIPQLPVELAIVRLCGVPQRSLPLDEDVAASPEKTFKDFQIEEVDSSHANVIASEAKQSFDHDVHPISSSVPVISINEVKQKWPQVYEQIKSCHVSLPMLMQACEVCGVEGEHVELGFEYGLYVDTVNQEKNRLIIEQVLEQVLGQRLRVRAIQKKQASREDETVGALLEEFGGSLV